MNINDEMNEMPGKLSTMARVTRILLGVGLLVLAISHDGVLGNVALLPLIAIYPLMTGMIGYGLVETLMASRMQDAHGSRRDKIPHQVIDSVSVA